MARDIGTIEFDDQDILTISGHRLWLCIKGEFDFDSDGDITAIRIMTRKPKSTSWELMSLHQEDGDLHDDLRRALSVDYLDHITDRLGEDWVDRHERVACNRYHANVAI